MGFFAKKLQALGGAPAEELLSAGLLGRGVIVGVRPTGVSMTTGAGEAQVCLFTVEVTLDNVAAYSAECRQSFAPATLSQLVTGEPTVAVRVDPQDRSRICIDLRVAPPTVTLARATGTLTAAQILTEGNECRAVIVSSQPMGSRNPEGLDMYAFALTMLPVGEAPYQVRVGMPVPADVVPLIYAGSKVPTRRLLNPANPGANPNAVVVDWKSALIEATADAF